jgi:outer membrane protein TolC
MQISLGWMTLSASLAILTPALSVNAQVDTSVRSQTQILVDSQVSSIISGSIPQTIPILGSAPNFASVNLGSVNFASVLDTLHISVNASMPKEAIADLSWNLFGQVPTSQLQPKLEPNRVDKQVDKQPVKLVQSILAALPLREIQLSSKPSYSLTTQEPDTLETPNFTNTPIVTTPLIDPLVTEVVKPNPAIASPSSLAPPSLESLQIKPLTKPPEKISKQKPEQKTEPATSSTPTNFTQISLKEITTSIQPVTKIAQDLAEDLPLTTTSTPSESDKVESKAVVTEGQVTEVEIKPLTQTATQTTQKPIAPVSKNPAIPSEMHTAGKPVASSTVIPVAKPLAAPIATPTTTTPITLERNEQKLPESKTPETKPESKIAPTTLTQTTAQTTAQIAPKPDPKPNTEPTLEPASKPTDITSSSETKPAQIASPVSSYLALEPAQTLVVPTTPSQVKLDRTKPITLAEAIELANKNNRDVIQARIAVERARATLRFQEAGRSPTASASVQYNFTDSAQARLGNIAAPFGTPPGNTISQPLTGTIGVQYNVFNSGLVDANIRSAENSLRIQESALNRATQVVRLTIATAYYQLQNTDENVRIQIKAVENAQRSLKDTKALERAGAGTKFDVLQSEVQLANAQQNLLNARAAQLIARRDMSRILEYPANLDLSAAEKIEPVQDWNMSLEDTIILAVRNRSDLDILKLQREVARDTALAALANLGPQVTLSANVNAADNFSQIGGIALGYQLGATVQWNFFDGGRAQAQVDQSKADQALAESQFEQTARQIRFDVEQAYITLLRAREQIITSTQALKSAEEALRLARLRLTAGVGTQLEVINAESALTQADSNRLQAITSFNLSISTLQRAINGL